MDRAGYIFIFLVFWILSATIGQENKSMAILFEEKYQDWRKWVQGHKFSSDLTGNKPYKEIINLGVGALPCIIEKMEKNPEDFHLESAFRQISKKIMGKDDYPQEKLGDAITASKYYINWWKEGRKNTKNDFEKLYNKWKESSNDTDKESDYIKLRNMGIVILPEIVEKFKKGDIDLVTMFSFLTDNDVVETASPEKCLKWWKENKKTYADVFNY